MDCPIPFVMINYLLLGGIAVGLGLLIGESTHLPADYRGGF